ncbi:MAG: threonine synthase [Microbacter sp.]
MRYYSTNRQAPTVSLEEAVVKGLAPDNGLYMPERWIMLPESFYETITEHSFQEIAFRVATAFFGDDVDASSLKAMVDEALSFETPVVQVEENLYALELFHGPTLAFKDVGARFMARLLSYFVKRHGYNDIKVLVATSGDTGSAVANGFFDVEGIHVYVLYPKGLVSDIQEKQFTTLGHNITALEIDGTFDDCQRLVKTAFMDASLNERVHLTSANSINLARFLPQSFYYFNAYAQLKRLGKEKSLVVSVPSGNFGNLTAGLVAARMGLPIKRFIAANNANDVFLNYLNTGEYAPRASVATIANAMDVGDPSNFARILDLYGGSHEDICNDISGNRFSDDQIRSAVKQCFEAHRYLLDPHGACGYLSLKEGLQKEETGLFLETAHPAKFKETIESVLQQPVELPSALIRFLHKKKQSIALSNRYEDLKSVIETNS